MAENAPYHCRLNAQRFEVRVLELSSGRWDQQLCGRLRTVSLNDKPPFEALSYTWGSAATGSKTIRVNSSHDMPITKNLFVALRRLRKRFTKRALWIDAVCINQEDAVEQGRQVSMMGDIYKAAARVLVWLGEYTEASLADVFNMRRPHIEHANGKQGRNSRGRRYAFALNEAISLTEPKWQDRAWVVQEFSMAREVRLCFGPVDVLYHPREIMDLVLHSPEPLEHLRGFHAKTSDMHKLKLGVSRRSQSICEAILYTSAASCSKPRDKVFSLLSLIDSREVAKILTDCELPCHRIYASATIAAIQARSDFQIFELVGFDQPRIDSLPTWTVDFTMRQNPSDGRIHQMESRSVVWMERPARPNIRSSGDDEQYLTIAGVEFDQVGTILKISAATASAPGEMVAQDLGAFLQTLIAARDGLTGEKTSLSFSQELASFSPSAGILSMHGPKTQVNNVIRTAFIVWNMVTGFSAQPREGIPLSSTMEEIRQESMRLDGIFIEMEYANFVAGGSVFFATVEGFIGVAPATMAEDDIIVLVHGSKYPMILTQQGDVYLFRGFAYVHGVWNNELVTAWHDRDVVEREFVLA